MARDSGESKSILFQTETNMFFNANNMHVFCYISHNIKHNAFANVRSMCARDLFSAERSIIRLFRFTPSRPSFSRKM